MNITISNYLAAWDPYGLIENESNYDEYDRKTRELKLAYTEEMSASEVGQLTYRVLHESFEHTFPGLEEECMRRGKVIKKILSQ